jgi:hypothetical protein
MARLYSLLLFVLLGFPSLSQSPLLDILNRLPAGMDTLIAQSDKYRIQIVYTQIDRDARNRPHFRTFAFGDTAQYFNPASTVKMPAAFLAMEKIRQLRILGLDKHSTMRIGAARPPQTAVQSDSTARDGLPSVAHYVKKIFLVSDNDAFNRLYEFLGQGYIHEQLRDKGYARTRIVHRLSVPGFDSVANRYTNPVSFYDTDGSLRYHQGEVFSKAEPLDMALGSQIVGTGHINNREELVQQPFDFSFRNYVGLRELHDMLQAVMFPEDVPPARRFQLSDEDYDFLYKTMSMLPRESDYPKYDPAEYYDSYVKFFLYGDRQDPMPGDIRIFNKVGTSYGFLTDIAYVADLRNSVEFMLAATIYVNADGILNDNRYEYDETGMPFLSKLGQAVHAYELQRPRRRKPDLSAWRKD